MSIHAEKSIIKKKSNNTLYVKSSKRNTNFNRIIVHKVRYKVGELFNLNLFNKSRTCQI